VQSVGESFQSFTEVRRRNDCNGVGHHMVALSNGVAFKLRATSSWAQWAEPPAGAYRPSDRNGSRTRTAASSAG
jgi:hypothetical protein